MHAWSVLFPANCFLIFMEVYLKELKGSHSKQCIIDTEEDQPTVRPANRIFLSFIMKNDLLDCMETNYT